MDKIIILVLVVIALLSGIAVIYLTVKLNDGKRQIQNGRWELAKYDNWFIRIFAGRKLDEGWGQIFAGEKKISFWKKVRVALVFACVGCVIGAICVILMS